MGDPRVTRLMALFERALEVPYPLRAEFVDEVATDDADLGEELRSLLDAHESADDYFDGLAEQVVSPAVTALVEAADRERDAALLAELQDALGDRYRVVRELDGGMSRVFLAEEVKLGRKVVVKLLPPATAAGASAERFRREIRVAAQLQHPHIVPLLTSDVAGPFLYYTMPFVAGESLRARLAREGTLSIRDAQQIWRDMLDALAHAHASGVIHCDVKPGNVLLSARNALVSDFGIARAVRAAGADEREPTAAFSVGTPAYMAPEQVLADPGADLRVDVYAAGLVMYEMLEGRLPFAADAAHEIALARLTREPAPMSRSDCPPELAALVMRCLAAAPAARPQTVEALLGELDGLSSGATTDEPRSLPATRRPPRVRGTLAFGLTAVVLVTVSVAAGLRNDRPTAAASPPAAAPPAPSIAVLPLRSLSADQADSALAGGMTEELITTLSAVEGLRVSASTSVYALADRGLDVRQIAESLRVTHVLEGALQNDGRRLRLQLTLVDARDGGTRWSNTFERERSDIFAVQDDIAWAVTHEVDARLAQESRASGTTRRYTPTREAYELYLRGIDPSLARTAARAPQAREYLTRAIAADSSFASAYAALSRVDVVSAGERPGRHGEWFTRAEQAASRAVALDDSLPEAHSALGWARLGRGDWAGARAALERAITLDFHAYRAHEGLARLHLFGGRPTAQLEAARIGVSLDPFSVQAIRELALALAVNDRCDEAIERLRPLRALSPPSGMAGIISGQCYAARHRWREAIAEFHWANETGARAALAFLAHAQARAGQREAATAILADLLAGRQDSHGAFGIAIVYAGLGDFDAAFPWLERAVDERSWRPYLWGPMLDDLRRDPRFARVKRRMGL